MGEGVLCCVCTSAYVCRLDVYDRKLSANKASGSSLPRMGATKKGRPCEGKLSIVYNHNNQSERCGAPNGTGLGLGGWLGLVLTKQHEILHREEGVWSASLSLFIFLGDTMPTEHKYEKTNAVPPP